MDRATFEKIVGGANVLFSSKELGTVEIEIGPENCLLITQGSDVFAIDSSSPFRLRCLLHGLGIKCDWDEPVTAKFLESIPNAQWMGSHLDWILVIAGTVRFDFVFDTKGGGWILKQWPNVQTQRQVHLLLEAAGVGG